MQNSAITVINKDIYIPLKEVMKKHSLQPSDIIEIIGQVTQQIVILHAIGIQHIHISLDRIFVVQTHPWVNIVVYRFCLLHSNMNEILLNFGITF